MDCLATRKKFKNKHPVWSNSADGKAISNVEPSGPNRTIATEVDSGGSDCEESQGIISSDSDDDLDMYANDIRSSKVSLESKELQFKHLTNINNDRSFNGGVRQVQFNPKSKVALVSLTHGQADLYEVDGERNRYIQNIALPRTNTPFCMFKPDGNSIVISSGEYKGSFYIYDMISGEIKRMALRVGGDCREMTDFTIYGDYMACRKEGSQEVVGLSSKTYENTFSIKINEPVKKVIFSPHSSEIFIAGEDAKTYIWDLRKTSICRHKFQDDGSVHTVSLALSESSKLLSIGSDSGCVNTYELEQCTKLRFPSPIKTIHNLKTPIDMLEYNHTGELLFMGSSHEAGAIRLMHSYSGTIFRNFPLQRKQYGHILSANFSPLSGYLTIGSSNGRANLIRLHYYKYY